MHRTPHRIRIAPFLLPTLIVPALTAVLALVGGCASPVESSWTDPSVAGRPLELRRVATIAMLEEGARRRVAEDDLARAIEGDGSSPGTGIDAEPSYELLEAEALQDAPAARSRLKEAGFDGAVTLSIVDEERRVSGSPSVGLGWGRYGYGGRWGVAYDTGSVRSDRVIHVQLNIYDLVADKLLWSGTTRSTNPDGVKELVRDVVHDVGRALRDQGLLPDPGANDGGSAG